MQKSLYFLSMLKERATSRMLPTESVSGSNLTEQWRLQGAANTHFSHVAVAEWRERTWLGTAVWTDVKESSPRCQTTTKSLLVTRE